MQSLSACPLCRADLEQLGATASSARADIKCPECGADLTVYNDIAQRARALARLTREFLSTGQVERARASLAQLTRLVPRYEMNPAPLQARLALADGDFDTALRLAGECEAEDAEQITKQLEVMREGRMRARELYNYALTCARRGATREAAGYLEQAVALDPLEPRIWELKLKSDLREHRLHECYRDLAALDGLAARPPEFYQLEQLLPPLAG